MFREVSAQEMGGESVSHIATSVGNLRDLGGLATIDGRVIAPGCIFRSSHFAELASHDEPSIAALGFRTRVDLRGEQERSLAPNRWGSVNLREMHLPIEPRAMGSLRAHREAGTLDDGVVLTVMHEVYRRFVHQRAPVFSALLRLVQVPDNYPLVFHCTAGKDRTGFAAALLLLALDVPRSTIIDDFLRSNGRWKMNAPSQDLTLLAQVRAEYLETSFAEMAAGWGSVDAYLAQELGLDRVARDRLASHLLIPAPRA